MKKGLVAAMIIIVIAGCTRLSSENLALVDKSVTFDHLLAAPDSYIGKTVVLGGNITAITRNPEAVVVEIDEFDLDKDFIPKEKGHSQGCFLATSLNEADLAGLQTGDAVTVIGEVKGKRTRMREGSSDYTFPVVAIREIRKWNTPENGPRTLENDYDPYYSGYPGDPYKDRPTGPVLKRY